MSSIPSSRSRLVTSSGPPAMRRITSVAVLSDTSIISLNRLSTVARTGRPPDQDASGLCPGRKSVVGTTIRSSRLISPRSTRRRNSSAIGTFDTLAMGNRRSPFTDTRAPDSMWMAAIPISPPTRREIRSSSRVRESGTRQANEALGSGACARASLTNDGANGKEHSASATVQPTSPGSRTPRTYVASGSVVAAPCWYM